MLVARSQHGSDLLALELFERMQTEGFNPSNACFLCIMRSCANIGAMLRGKLVHFSLLLQSHESDAAISIGALIDMYAKCGHAEEARKLFDRWQHRGEISSWGSLISGYARVGRIGPARRCFIGMRSSGIEPNAMVFTSMMTACCHEGLMEEGLGYFRSMQGEHGIDPSLEHYGCLIDLLGRLGALDEACDLPGSMPMPPDLVVWRALLHACKLHDDEALGSYCFGNRLAPSSLYKLASSDYEGLSSGEVTGPRVYECPSRLSEDEPLYVPFFGCEYSPSFSEDLLER
jgi:pentatricopeptide repeat protein